MTHITAQTLEQLASLSALELSPEETAFFANDIERILTYVDQLAELNTDGVEPTYQVTGLHNVWRDDEAIAGHDELAPDDLLSLAKENVVDNQIKVPKVL